MSLVWASGYKGPEGTHCEMQSCVRLTVVFCIKLTHSKCLSQGEKKKQISKLYTERENDGEKEREREIEKWEGGSEKRRARVPGLWLFLKNQRNMAAIVWS